jgi:hypothetical protein
MVPSDFVLFRSAEFVHYSSSTNFIIGMDNRANRTMFMQIVDESVLSFKLIACHNLGYLIGLNFHLLSLGKWLQLLNYFKRSLRI